MRTTRGFFLIMLTICLMVAPVHAAASSASVFTDVDAYVEAYLTRNRIPGVSLVVAQGTKSVYARGYGTAGHNRPMTADTPMFIGSQTKSFTALAVMQLVEAGQVDLEAPVQHYIPWFKVADSQASTQITVHSLLNHTSGLSEVGYIPNLPDSSTIEQAVRDLQSARPSAKVGEKFQYFNPGYITLGYLVEVVSGQNFGDYVRKHIFEPLGMLHSSASIDEFAGMDMAQGFSQIFSFPVAMKQRIPKYYLPAGFIVSTANDMSLYLMAMQNGGELSGQRILSKGGIRSMLTPNRAIGSQAGFGWDISSYYGKPQITHGGATERFYTSVVILPESGLSVVMIFNQDHMFKATYDYLPLFWGVVNILTGHTVVKQGISSIPIGWGLLAAFLVVLFFSIRGMLGLREERRLQRDLLPGRRWLRILPHLVWIGVTLGMVMVIGPSMAGRGFDLRWFIGFYPDVAWLTAIVVIAETIQLTFKAIITLIYTGVKNDQPNSFDRP
jgi:CubicO group peptidase (beta-lactamase class C family)